VHATVDAEFFDGADKTEACIDYADRPHDRRRVSENLVTPDGNEIAARCGKVLDEDERLLVGFVGQLPDAVGNETRLYGGAARRIDDDGHGRCFLDAEGTFKQRVGAFDVDAA